MTAKLPSRSCNVNDNSQPAELNLELCTNEDRVSELVRDVDRFYRPAVPFTHALKSLYARLCIEAIDSAIQARECLCLHCCVKRAGESAWALFALRAEVLYRTGKSCNQIAHNPTKACPIE